MAEYDFRRIEKYWQQWWQENKTYKVTENTALPKFYVLDMFPYPSGSGLHVGHPLGYIASDIYSRYKKLKGFNVLHPMGFDAFGLPAEQYAIQTGQHPAVTTEKNIARYKEQFFKLGFSYDWEREVITSDPKYYKWTQWTFVQLFNHWYDKTAEKARSIALLVDHFENAGSKGINPAASEMLNFSANEWKSKTQQQQQAILMNYRLAYQANTTVNWCPGLGTVLANDEVREGYSVRGGYPVYQKEMKQWLLRVTAYTNRLLNGLDLIEWSDSLKEMQRNWIGKSEGAIIRFKLKNSENTIEVFTTRADTLFGSSFIVLAPEHELVKTIASAEKIQEIETYLDETRKRTERDRISDVKRITGVFTGAYVIHPFNGNEMPVWVADYVLVHYGTGAIMAVPGHDNRDNAFARHFNLPILQVVDGVDISEIANEAKEGKMINSDFLNGLEVRDAISKMSQVIEEKGLGLKKTNYRLRDAIFSRQRYWGEPFPVYYKDEIPYTLDEDRLPLVLPHTATFLPAENGQAPLAAIKDWRTAEGFEYEKDTMPGFAGSSGYYLRYMDPTNEKEYFSRESVSYWQDVDLYIGGTEHATGHLIYSRFWNKFLYDIGLSIREEPFRKLVNQGMIQGRSNIAYRLKDANTFISANLRDQYEVMDIHVDVSLVQNDVLDTEAFRNWRPEYADATFVLENGKYVCGYQVEKMSKSLHNVVNPDEIIDKYGSDTFRMYEMFLGPIEQHKPWNTDGIEGVSRFLKKFWALFFDEKDSFFLEDSEASAEELRILHKTIRKIGEDIENLSFNTSVSAFMITVNELAKLKCRKRGILEPLVILISPFAPHIAEELWKLMGKDDTVTTAVFPAFNPEFVIEDVIEYPVSVNGKLRTKQAFSKEASQAEVETLICTLPEVLKWAENKPIKKIIFVPGRIINVVTG